MLRYAEDYITQCQELLEDPNADKNTKSKTSSLTYVQAKRALERVILFDELRKHVIPQSDKVLGEKFEVLKDPFIISQSGLPSWWVPVVHDCVCYLSFNFAHSMLGPRQRRDPIRIL